MPSSRPDHIPTIISVLTQIAPSSILDIGIGFGKWGFLFREYTDIRLSEVEPERYLRQNWRVRIEGIEGHERYITDLHRLIYNDIHIGDMRLVIETLPSYDMIFLGDVIEHVEKEDGRKFLWSCLQHTNKTLVLSTPAKFVEQVDICGNELERHKSFWTPADFKEFGRVRTRVTDHDILVVVIAKEGSPMPICAPLAEAYRTINRNGILRRGRRVLGRIKRMVMPRLPNPS